MRDYRRAETQPREARLDAERQAKLYVNFGLPLLKARRYAWALDAFLRAVELQPEDPEVLFLAVFAAYRSGHWVTARTLARRALALDPAADTEETLRLLLDASHHGQRSAGRGKTISLALGGGYDTNIAETGPNADDEMSSFYMANGSPFITASWLVAYGWVVDEPWLYIRPSYSGLEIAFTSNAIESHALQSHTLNLSLDVQATSWLRFLGGPRASFLVRGGQLPSQSDLGGSLGLGVDWSGRTTTEVVWDARRIRDLGEQSSYTNGSRLDLTASQRLRFGRTRFKLLFRERWTRRGSLAYFADAAPHPRCDPTCTGVAEMPLSHRAHLAGGQATFTLSKPVALDLEVGVERRVFTTPARLELDDATLGESFLAETLERRDDRVWAGVGMGVALSQVFDIDVEYQWLNSSSNLGRTRTAIETTLGNANFMSHSVSAELRATW